MTVPITEEKPIQWPSGYALGTAHSLNSSYYLSEFKYLVEEVSEFAHRFFKAIRRTASFLAFTLSSRVFSFLQFTQIFNWIKFTSTLSKIAKLIQQFFQSGELGECSFKSSVFFVMQLVHQLRSAIDGAASVLTALQGLPFFSSLNIVWLNALSHNSYPLKIVLLTKRIFAHAKNAWDLGQLRSELALSSDPKFSQEDLKKLRTICLALPTYSEMIDRNSPANQRALIRKVERLAARLLCTQDRCRTQAIKEAERLINTMHQHVTELFRCELIMLATKVMKLAGLALSISFPTASFIAKIFDVGYAWLRFHRYIIGITPQEYRILGDFVPQTP